MSSLPFTSAPPLEPAATADARPIGLGTPRGLGPFFWLASNAPTFAQSCRPIAERIIPPLSATVRRNTRLNAARIFGRDLSSHEQAVFTREVVGSFYRFVTDIGRCSRETPDRLRSRIATVHGEAEFKELRARGRGAVLVTAHMGSFEVGLGALSQVESRIHVVFKRDASGPFEAMRARMRHSLGILESPIDDGLTSWLALRDALLSNEVIVMQADRAIPGQRSEVVPFLHGHLRVPTGPVRLARLTGSPIVPVFTVHDERDRFTVHLSPPIDPGKGVHDSRSPDPAVVAIAQSIEKMVARYPTQWLALCAAFEEDAHCA